MAELAYWEVYTMNQLEARQRLIQTYRQTHNFTETARRWGTSRHLVRKWVRRYQAQGEAGLQDRSRRPHRCPRQTPAEVEQQVMAAWEKTRYGRRRLALYLQRQGLDISPHTIRHVFRRHRPSSARKRRKILYPAHWAWQVQASLSLLQTDVKDVLDKGALGTRLTTHLSRHHLPRYQWTACDGRTRLRFLAYSLHNNRDNGLAFLILVLMWLRALGAHTQVTFQTDWGQEFGGNNPEQVAALSQRFLAPLDGQLARYPKGRKGYNGRVERSHRTDDEEFYRPYLLNIPDLQQHLVYAHRWEYFYNVLRPHLGEGMENEAPLTVLRRLGYRGSDAIAAFPPVLLDNISTDLLLACDSSDGNDLLTHYSLTRLHLLLVRLEDVLAATG